MRRLRTCLMVATGALAQVALAQSGKPVAWQFNPQPEYVDRVLDANAQETESSGEDPNAYNKDGWPRSLKLEYTMASVSQPSPTLSRAVSLSGFLDTPNHGAFSLNANWVGAPNGAVTVPGQAGASRATWRLDQRAFPLEGGWFANHSLGNINTLTPSMAHGIGRIYLPTTPMQGFAGQWVRGDQLDLNLAQGRVGLFSGLDINAFDKSSGQVSSAGGQLRLSGSRGSDSSSHAALQYVEARHILDGTQPVPQDFRSMWGSMSWEGLNPLGSGALGGNKSDPIPQRQGGLSLQGNLLQSASSTGDLATGAWLDSKWRTQWMQNTAGLFYFQPNLRWGATLTANDLKGLYWRSEVATRQWQLGWSTEYSDTVSGLGGHSGFASMFGTYKFDTRNSVATTLSLRNGNGAGELLDVSWNHASDWGQTQWRGAVTHTVDTGTTFLGVDHNWLIWQPLTLSSSAGWLQTRSTTVEMAKTWGLLAGYSPLSRVRLDASIRGANSQSTQSLQTNLGLTWQLLGGWSINGRYTESRGQDVQVAQLQSALTVASSAPVVSTPSSRSVMFILRYETGAGTPTVPLGGAPGSAAGSLGGMIYFDANNNGRRDASESGVPNIVVVLDYRFIVRTDAQGRYEFPSVAAGDHVIQIQPDNVPLPWQPVDTQANAVVHVRSKTDVDFPLQRDR